MFRDENFYTFIKKSFTLFLMLYIGQHKDHQAQLAAFNRLDAYIYHCHYHWSFYYDAAKLLQEEYCIIITSNWKPK